MRRPCQLATPRKDGIRAVCQLAARWRFGRRGRYLGPTPTRSGCEALHQGFVTRRGAFAGDELAERNGATVDFTGTHAGVSAVVLPVAFYLDVLAVVASEGAFTEVSRAELASAHLTFAERAGADAVLEVLELELPNTRRTPSRLRLLGIFTAEHAGYERGPTPKRADSIYVAVSAGGAWQQLSPTCDRDLATIDSQPNRAFEAAVAAWLFWAARHHVALHPGLDLRPLEDDAATFELGPGLARRIDWRAAARRIGRAWRWPRLRSRGRAGRRDLPSNRRRAERRCGRSRTATGSRHESAPPQAARSPLKPPARRPSHVSRPYTRSTSLRQPEAKPCTALVAAE
jgi:hypothetical protein